jgi:hypothetical protein
MPDAANHLTFALICLGMVLTPGPNMIYLISRSLSQGPKAGLISLGGVALGFLFYVVSAAFGITALISCSISPGRRCGPADARPSRSRNCRATARENCSPWG